MDDTQDQDYRLIRSGAVNFGFLFTIVRVKSAFFLTALLAVLFLSIVYLHVAHKKYAVTMQVTPVSSPSGSSNSGLRALGAVAGINLGDSADPQFRVFLDSLQSPVAAEALVGRQGLLKQLFPAEWSESEKRWREPPSLLRPVTHFVEGLLGFDVIPWSPPSEGRLYDFLMSELKVIQDQKSGVVTLEIDSDDPAVATHVLLALNSAIDERMRKRALTRKTSDIAYLTDKLASVTVAEYRQALISNLAEQEKTRMMASAPVPFVSEVLGAPTTSVGPTSPSPIATLAMGLVLGVMAGVGWSVLAFYRGWIFRFPDIFRPSLPGIRDIARRVPRRGN